MIQQKSMLPVELQKKPDLLLDEKILNVSSSFLFTIKNGSSVVLGDDIEIEIEYNSTSPESYQLTVGKCWATPTDTRVYAEPKYDITDCFGCPLDANDTTEVINNGAAKIEIKFQSFMWAKIRPPSQTIYLNCEINICYNLLENCTAAQDCKATLPNSCPSRSKRSLLNTKENVITSKPILVSSKNLQITRKCSINNGGCEELCYEIPNVNEFIVLCGCKPGQYLDIDEVSCKSLSEESSNEETFSDPTDF